MRTVAPAPAAKSLLRVNHTTWRVLAPDGRPIGNIVAVKQAEGVRYHARRYHVPTGSHLEFGSFWRFEEAHACLRWL